MLAYNYAFCRARVVIEQCFGVLKRRFSVLKTGIRFPDMSKSARLIKVLAAIHNFILDQDSKADDIEEEDGANVVEDVFSNDPVSDDDDNEDMQDARNGLSTRDKILSQYFMSS